MRWILFFVMATGLFSEELKWTPSEMMKVKSVSDVRVSADGKEALFVVSEARKEGNKYYAQIYRTKMGGEAEALTERDVSCFMPRWSPDGKQIAYLGSGGNKLMLRGDGEARVLLDSKNPILLFSWSPNGQKIALVLLETIDREMKEVSYQFEEQTVRKGIWILDVADGTLKGVSGDYFVRCLGDFGTVPNQEFDWSPDGKEITFAYTNGETLEEHYLNSSIASVDLESGAITAWEKKGQHESMPRYSPDGKWISYLSSGTQAKYDLERYLAVQGRDGKEWRRLAPTPDEGPFLTGPNNIGWTGDSRRVVYFEPKGTKFQLLLVGIDGSEARRVETGDCFFTEPSLNGEFIGFTSQAVNRPPEAFASRLEEFTCVQLSKVNESFLEYPEVKTEVVRWKSSDGMEIEGLLSYPVGYEGQRVPLLLVVHGGPMGFFNESFVGLTSAYPIAAFANAGYAVLRANPRGSCGYGKDFRWLNFRDWGGMDFEDLMTGIDSLVEKGIADPERLGVMGFSYGGYMTAWTITQTKRFKAASMGAGPSNLVSLSNTMDLHYFVSNYFGKECWEDPAILKERSPIFYVDKVGTPCLIQHGANDMRVPTTQSIEFYNALKKSNKRAAFYIYPRMTHRSMEYKQILDFMEKNLNWFNEHLM